MRISGTNILEELGKMRYNLLKPVTIIGPFIGLFVSEDQSPVGTVIVGIALIINIITSYVYLYFNFGDIGEFVKGIPTTNIFTSAMTCLALSFIKRKAYVRVLKEVNYEFEAEFENATESTKRGMFAANISLIILVLSIVAVFVGYVTDPFVSEERIIATPAWYPFDTDNPIGYAIVFMIQLFGGGCAGVLIALTGIYFTNVMEQTCLHFDNLSNSLSMRLEMEMKNCESSIEKNAEKSLNEFLVKIIERHNALLRRIKVVNDVFSTFFLIYCIILVPIISAAALEFVSFERAESTTFYMKHASVVTVGLVLLHGPCKCGSKIVIAQADVSHAVYSEKPMIFSESIKRTLSIINSRAQIPNIITTGGFVSFDMVAYSQALGLFYTIFMMLHHLKATQET